MAMRQDCKHFKSQTFSDGDTLSKCTLNLAPEAPWRCPANCGSYERRRIDVNLSHQKIAGGTTADEPLSLEDGDDSVARLLADVANIIDDAAPTMVEEIRAEAKRNKGWRRFIRFGRRGGKGKKS